MTTKYTLEQFNNIIFDGFDYTVSPEIIKIISNLALEVGSPSYIKTPIFKKKDIFNNTDPKKKVGGGGGTGIALDPDWKSDFQVTKFTEKSGIDAQIDNICSHLNKITDKT